MVSILFATFVNLKLSQNKTYLKIKIKLNKIKSLVFSLATPDMMIMKR